MNIQKREGAKLGRLRDALSRLTREMGEFLKPYFLDTPVMKGTVYELRRRCGKPGCKCARGELHRCLVVSASEKGRTRLRVIDQRDLVEVRRKVTRYRELRRMRARLGVAHKRMLAVLDQMIAVRREELRSSGARIRVPAEKGRPAAKGAL
jgi:hypothetical protein